MKRKARSTIKSIMVAVLFLAVAVMAVTSFAEEKATGGGAEIGAPGTNPPVETEKAEELPKGVKKFSYSEGYFSVLTENADIKDLMRMFSNSAGVEIVVSDGVEGKATVEITELPLIEAVKKTLETAGQDNWAVSTRQEKERTLITKITVLKKSGSNGDGGFMVGEKNLIRFMSEDGTEKKSIKTGKREERLTGDDAEKFAKAHLGEIIDHAKDATGKFKDVVKFTSLSHSFSDDNKYVLLTSMSNYFIANDSNKYNFESPHYYCSESNLLTKNGEELWAITDERFRFNIVGYQSAIMADGSAVLKQEDTTEGTSVLFVDRFGATKKIPGISEFEEVSRSRSGMTACVDSKVRVHRTGDIMTMTWDRATYVINNSGEVVGKFEYNQYVKLGPPNVKCGDDIIELIWVGSGSGVTKKFTVNGTGVE